MTPCAASVSPSRLRRGLARCAALACALALVWACDADDGAPSAPSAPTTAAPAATPPTPDPEPDARAADPQPPAASADPAAPDAAEGAASAADPAPSAGEPGPEPAEAAPAAARAPVRADWIDWVATHCRVNELGYSDYGNEWMAWIRAEGRKLDSFMPPDAPRLNFRPEPLPAPGSPEAAARAAALREDWLGDPRSQVVECPMTIAPRDCPKCYPLNRRFRATRTAYTAYLPRALFERPERVRSLLLLAPGGNGGRTRYFLTPIPNKGVWDKRSGGLEVKRHTDEILAANPALTPAIVVSLDHGGWPMANGHAEFLSHDAPLHFAQTYLGLDTLDEVAVGVEGISKGARAIMLALRSKPEGFNVVGLTCLHCGEQGASGGFNPKLDLGYAEPPLARWLEVLRGRVRAGEFFMRFSVGNMDNQWPCNKEVYDAMVAGGVFRDVPPTFERCRTGKTKAAQEPHPSRCTTHWDSFHLFDGEAHNYGLLIPAWRPQLEWLLGALDKAARAKAAR